MCKHEISYSVLSEKSEESTVSNNPRNRTMRYIQKTDYCGMLID